MYSERMISQVEEKVESVEDDVSELRTIMRKFAKRQKRQEDLITRLRAGQSTPEKMRRDSGFRRVDSGTKIPFNVNDDEAPTSDKRPNRLNRQGTMGILQRSDSIFHYKDLTQTQIDRLEDMFESIPSHVLKGILEESLEVRRIKAISIFCDVDFDTAKHYLEKYAYNPEPVVSEIDSLKTTKFKVVWYFTSIVVALSVIYFVWIDMLPNFLKIHGTHHWTVNYSDTDEDPLYLPVTLIAVLGASSADVTPYTIHLESVDETGIGTARTEFCGPDPYSEDCWTNDGKDALICSDEPDVDHFADAEGFHWGLCRKTGVTRLACPTSWPIMCSNLKANMGIEPYCGLHEDCASRILGGPRICSDGRDLGSVLENPTSCSVTKIPSEDAYEEMEWRHSRVPKAYSFGTMIFIMPPNRTIHDTREEYYISLRVKYQSGQVPLDWGLQYSQYTYDEIAAANVKTASELFDFFYAAPTYMIQELPAGGKSNIYINPIKSIYSDGREDNTPGKSTTLQSETYMWYHTAVSARLSSNRYTISEEVATTNIMNGFIGPAGGIICLLLQIQSAVFLIVLTGVYIPCCGGKHFLGWRMNHFDEDFRTKMILYNNIYHPDFADQEEGMNILSARTVTWPSNRVDANEDLNTFGEISDPEEGSSSESEWRNKKRMPRM